MSELFEGRDWEFVEELVAPVLDYHVYGQRCPDCGWIFTLGYGSHKWIYCPMCGKSREKGKKIVPTSIPQRIPQCDVCANWDKDNRVKQLNMSWCSLNQMNTFGYFYCSYFDERRNDATLH